MTENSVKSGGANQDESPSLASSASVPGVMEPVKTVAEPFAVVGEPVSSFLEPFKIGFAPITNALRFGRPKRSRYRD